MNKYDLVRRNYDNVNVEFHNKYNPVEEFSEELDNFVSQLPKGGSILVIGGIPSECKYLLDKGFVVTNIDISSKMLNQIQQELPGVKLLKGSIHDYQFYLTFDGILAIRSLIHIPPDDLEKTLSVIERILAPGGQFTAVFFTTDTDNLVEEEKPDELAVDPDILYYRVLYPQSYLSNIYERVFDCEPQISIGKDMDGEEYMALSVAK